MNIRNVLILLLATHGLAFAVNAAEGPTAQDRALVESAFNGDLDSVKLHLNKGADIEATGPKSRTALMWAAANDHTGVVEYLLEQGADVNAEDSDGQTALMYAASGLYPATAKILLQNGADVDAQSKKRGFTALMIAASGGHEEFVSLLLEHGADTTIEEWNGRKAVDRARQYGHAEVAALLEKESTTAAASDS